ncbi:peptidoglycan/xylan/chitin deacetylase (PgdA/CDA1 family) [Evansella vedderi]|uniref:Peptidoglycan/xylan/chitin deacetylase (PgdA/CDA1 family) n=1 Tax=Evansella vedderi TaxID=38282 RepID=A0ABT9ZTF1_9BACI|nr:polysaccharide deacetylase family protein [Evansella vedderi]MDQ0254519.1 peptidoglycan/xylan/chitin deacetylase (PgdA/CDA1 family) [Evansella vedderi]
MSLHHIKLLELLSVHRMAEKSFLKIKFSFGQEMELFWEIDQDTATHLMELTEYHGQSKYRLSFHSSWDPIKKQNTSIITRTFKDHSKKIYFSCSREYLNQLNAIKDIQQLSEYNDLSFLTKELPMDEQELQEQEVLKSKDRNGSYTWRVLTVVCLAIFLLGYSGYDYVNKTVSGEDFHVITGFTGKETVLSQKDFHSISRDLSIDPHLEHTLPYLELNELLTFSIPEGNVAITFDDGPSLYTKEITDILLEYQVGGTFFFVGSNVKKYPENVRYVHSNGYSIGSHSNNHINMKPLSNEDQENELLIANQTIQEITLEPVDLFRPPFGAYDERMLELMTQFNNKMVLWNIDPEDWRTHNPKDIYNHIRQSDVSGSIILLHETQAVVDALPKIIEYLQEEGLQMVNLR